MEGWKAEGVFIPKGDPKRWPVERKREPAGVDSNGEIRTAEYGYVRGALVKLARDPDVLTGFMKVALARGWQVAACFEAYATRQLIVACYGPEFPEVREGAEWPLVGVTITHDREANTYEPVVTPVLEQFGIYSPAEEVG